MTAIHSILMEFLLLCGAEILICLYILCIIYLAAGAIRLSKQEQYNS